MDAETKRKVLALLEQGQRPYQICAELKLTPGQVAGFMHRVRQQKKRETMAAMLERHPLVKEKA